MKRTIKLLLLAVLGTWMAGSAMADEHYLVGGCTDSGWNTGENTRSTVAMMQVSDDVWVWCGKLTTGEGDNGRFKIPDGAGSWNGYWAPAQGTILTSEWSDLSTNSDGDNKYCVAEEGYYKVTINTNTKKIKAEKLTEPTTKEGDYYLINTVADYYWFASAVISGQQSLKARLNDDLDFSTDGFFPLGNDKDVDGNRTHNFKGEFDGQGHAMTGIAIKGSYSKLAPFRSIDGATIKNLKVVGVINSNSQFMGGMVSQSRGSSVIENVVVDMAMTSSHSGDGTHGGVIAVAWGTPTMKNIAVVGSINATNDDGTCGMIGYAHSGSSVKYTNCFIDATFTLKDGNNRLFGRNGEYCTNCYTTNTTMTKLNENDHFDGAEVTAEQVASGELAYKLNGNSSENVAWFQKLGTDALPMPFGDATTATVYAVGELYCDGTSKGGDLTFSNTNESSRDEHHFNEWGFCDKVNNGNLCNDLQLDFMTPNGDGYYEIGTKAQLNWFAVRVNGHKTTTGIRDINGKLTADIDFSDQTNMIGNGDEGESYQGIFDGQGHKVKVAYAVSQKNVALFRYLKNANIKNLITEGTINNENNSCAGGIFAGSRGNTVIENCVSYVTLSRNNGGDATFGGIGAYMHDNGKIKNCAFYGSIETPNATGNGGMLGYANGGGNIAIENCIVNATAFTFSGNSVSIARNTGNVKHTYVVNAGSATQNEAKTATAAQVASGELAFIINGESESGMAWYQKLGTDAEPAPLPFVDANKVVYQNGDLYCDGMSKGSAQYSNTEGQNRDPHYYGTEWGLCTNSHDGIVCDDANPDFVAQESGYYPLKDKKELNWFALFVNQGKGDAANAKLTDDIDMSAIDKFPGIGTNDHRYAGTFDGNGKKIYNLVMNWDQQGVGLICRATDGVHVKNLTIDGTCSFTGKEGVAAFIGGTYGNGGSFIIENCGNEAAVNATSKNAGAFIGCNYANADSRAKFLNCYNTGAINSTAEGGAFSGWAHKAFIVENCYNTGALSGCEGFVRGYEEVIRHSFSTSNTSSGTYGRAANNEISADDVTDGSLFTNLFDYNANGVNGNIWHMDFDINDNPKHPIVCVPETLVVKDNFPNRIVAGEQTNVKVVRSMVNDGNWFTLCLPFDINDISVDFEKVAELTGVNGTTLQFTSVSTIEAGKAYLVKIKGDIDSFIGNYVEVKASAPTTVGDYTFTGIYEPTLIAENDLFVAGDNKLQPSDGNGKLQGFRAYIKVNGTSPSRATSFVVDDTTTGIIGIDGTVIENGKIYNLNGQKVQNAQKGLYIVNGKKVVVK